MFPRCTLFLGFFMLIIAVIDVSANEEPAVQDVQASNSQSGEVDEAEERNPLLAVAIRLIMQAFKWAAKHCAKEAAQNCKQHWKHPKVLIKCGGAYLKRNKGRCVTG